LLDIPTDMETRGVFLELHGHPDTRAFAHDLNTVLEHAFGTASPAFVDKLIPCLVPNLENFQKHLTNFNKKARATLDLPEDGVTARALKRFGLISLAGELATGFEITGWDNGEATDAAIETLRLWVLGHDLPTDDDVSSSVRRLAGYVAANQNRFMALDTASAQLPQAFVGWVDQTRYYFTADAWAEAHRGHDLIDVGHQLQSRQLLATNDSGLKWRLPRRFTGRPRCYAVWRAGVDSTAPVSTAA
jgi:putative DNA primase/helicase